MDAFDLMMYRIPQKAPEAQILGVLVQEMVQGRREVILGMNRDPHFGPLMMFGMGGIDGRGAEGRLVLPGAADGRRGQADAHQHPTYQMLQGVRGEEGVDIDAIAEGLQRLSQLVTEFPRSRKWTSTRTWSARAARCRSRSTPG